MADPTNKLVTARPNVATTLSSPIGAADVSATFNNLGSYANGDRILITLDAHNNAGEDTPALKELVYGEKNGNTLINMVRAVEGNAQSHAAGAEAIDEVTAAHHRLMHDALVVGHDPAGAHRSNLPLTSPRITTGLLDANLNEALDLPATASAVNQLVARNSATGQPVSLEAAGDDTNIGLNIKPKGTGKVEITNLYGWQPSQGAWTYVSATSMTVPAADAALMSVGTKIWLNQSGSKYFYVTGIAGTTITITGGSDYTLANAAITAPYFSNAATPVGFPQWFNYTPTWTNLTVGNAGTNTGRFQMIGKTVRVEVDFEFCSTSDVTGDVSVSFPVTAASHYRASTFVPLGTAIFHDAGSEVYFGRIAQVDSTTAAKVYYEKSPGAENVRGVWTTTEAFDTASGDDWCLQFEYVAA